MTLTLQQKNRILLAAHHHLVQPSLTRDEAIVALSTEINISLDQVREYLAALYDLEAIFDRASTAGQQPRVEFQSSPMQTDEEPTVSRSSSSLNSSPSKASRKRRLSQDQIDGDPQPAEEIKDEPPIQQDEPEFPEEEPQREEEEEEARHHGHGTSPASSGTPSKTSQARSLRRSSSTITEVIVTPLKRTRRK